MASKVYVRSFNGGVITPEMLGRIDDIKANTGLAVCRNFIPLPQGPVVNRPGFQFVRGVRYNSKFTRVLPFRFSATQTTVIEAGEAYFRFHTFGGTLLTPTTGLTAWNSGTAYVPGDLATKGGKTWYCVAASTNNDPETGANQYGSAPVITATWVESVPAQATPPAGYTNVGTELPTSAVIGQLVYISQTTYDWTEIYDYTFGLELSFVGLEPVESTVYIGYTGTANTSPSGFWYEMPVPYQIPSPYAEGDLADLRYVQSADIMTIVHPNYAPRELRRLSATKWVLSTITFGSTLAAPTISSVVATTAASPTDTQVYSYVATRVSDDQLDESVASAALTATNQLLDNGAFNTINFSTSARRNVYRQSGGLYGFIGQSTGTSLVDDNIAPDVSRTPPLNQNPFASDYPSAVCYYEQRRVFAGTSNLPQTVWMTKTGTESNLDYSIPVRDDDGISIKIASREANAIRHAVVIGDLLLLTDHAEWRISSAGDILTPATITARPQSYIGISNVQPVTVNNTAIYPANRGGHVRAVGFDFDVQSYVSIDLSLRAGHLFDFKTIRDMDYAKGPIPIVWAVSSDGRLLGLTYVPEQQVYAWHTHDTDGLIESIAVVGEGNDDILYAVISRTIGGSTVRYVERLASRYFAELKDGFFVDCGVTYSGAAATTISGLSHLEGKEVYILADGAVMEPKTVTSGSITLEKAASLVHVGLPIVSDLQTLPMSLEGVDGFGQGRVKNVNQVYLRVYRSSGIFVGPDENTLTEAKIRTTEVYGKPPNLKTEEIDIMISPSWTRDGQIVVRQSDPVPLTIVSATIEVQFGG
jgi:hypothetical protein